ncbi:50S ribosomal protein L17 [endosymbiont of Sipalinus gigas]|nr:50S ribosomal protein L17 [endosymbiont of Sipalinus gigas]
MKSIKHFNRTRSHYKLMFRNMCNSLIKYEKIKTTLNKAKELKKIIEPIINLSKIDNFNNRKLAFSLLRSKFSLFKLFDNLRKKFINRNGGYTRIIKYKYRSGDNALIAIIEFV